MAEAKDDEPRDSQGREEAGDSEDEHLYDDWDELASDPEEMSRLGRALEGLLPDIVRRGVDGLVSEDGIRSLVKDRELPREAAGFILGQVDATKREVLRIVSREVRMFLENVDLGGELTKILTSVSFEIRTEVRFIPNDAAVKPNVKNRVSIRGRDGTKQDLTGADEFPDEAPAETAGDESSESTGGEKGEESVEPPAGRRRRWRLRRRDDQDDEPKSEAEQDESGDSKG